MKIIGLHGKARSGKDVFADILCTMFGFKKIGFADKVKEFGIKYFNLQAKDCYIKKTKISRQILQGIGNHVRNYLHYVDQNISNETLGVSGYPLWVEELAVKEFNIEIPDLKSRKKLVKDILKGIHDLWTERLGEFKLVAGGVNENIWINYLFNSLNQDLVYVVSDVRYLNEKKIIEESGNYCVKIFRVDNPTIEAGERHKSEVDLDSETDWFEFIINQQKTDWQEALTLSAVNLVRKLDNRGMFTKEDKKKFKVKL